MNQFASLDKFLERAWQDRNVLAVLLYGSSARQEKRKGSDNDICPALRAGRNRRKNGFFSSKRLGYLEEFPWDVRVFQQLALDIRRRVLKEVKVLFFWDEEVLYALAVSGLRLDLPSEEVDLFRKTGESSGDFSWFEGNPEKNERLS